MTNLYWFVYIRINVLSIKNYSDSIFIIKVIFFLSAYFIFSSVCFRPLGQGAFGEVYEGQLLNPADNSYIPVAVKVSFSETYN